MRRRSPSRRVRIESLMRGELITEQEDRWRLVAPDGSILYRVWILGVVTAKTISEEQLITLTVDDGSGAITVKGFEQQLGEIDQWDRVEILATVTISPQTDEIDVYLAPDVISNLDDDNWILVHRLKIIEQSRQSQIGITQSDEEGSVIADNLKNKLKNAIRSLDTGDGVTFEDFATYFKTVSEELLFSTIEELLESGEFFEPRNGRYSAAF